MGSDLAAISMRIEAGAQVSMKGPIRIGVSLSITTGRLGSSRVSPAKVPDPLPTSVTTNPEGARRSSACRRETVGWESTTALSGNRPTLKTCSVSEMVRITCPSSDTVSWAVPGGGSPPSGPVDSVVIRADQAVRWNGEACRRGLGRRAAPRISDVDLEVLDELDGGHPLEERVQLG